MKRPALQNKRVGVSRIAFRTRKVFGTFEKRAPVGTNGKCTKKTTDNQVSTYLLNVRWCSIFATLGYRPAHRIALTSFKFSEKDTKWL